MPSIQENETLERLGDRYIELMEMCEHASGGTHAAIGRKLKRATNGEVDVKPPKLTRWFQKAQFPEAGEARALAAIISAHPHPFETGNTNELLARELETVCDELSRSKQARARRPAASDVDNLVRSAEITVREGLAGNPHPIFGSEIPQLLWKSSVADFQRSLRIPGRIVRNLSYDITIYGDGDQWNVRIENTADRVFQGCEEVFISYCSTNRALEPEYAEQSNGCLAREVVPLMPGETESTWKDRILQFPPSLTIDGVAVKPKARPKVLPVEHGSVLRFYYDASQTTLGSRPTRTTIISQYAMKAPMDEFPVRFNSYYCVGPTLVGFHIGHKKGIPQVEPSIFLPTPDSPWDSEPRSIDSQFAHYRVETGADTVLPPGSGILFRWTGP